jgi:Beta-propeller domains of methanol dehydrogenase type
MKQLIILVLFILNIEFIHGQQIIDYGKFLKDSEITDLTNQMIRMNKATTVQILLYTIMDLGGVSPKEYIHSLWEKYHVGLKGVNNGIVILLSKNDRKMQVTNGFGLEWILSDSESQKIVNEMISFFKKQEFYNGIKTALTLIDTKISKYSWMVTPAQPDKMSLADTGRIFKFHYSNKTGNRKYKYAIDTDPQFSDDFRIDLAFTNSKFSLYYTKYMNDMISQIVTKSDITIYARLTDYGVKKMELLGIE